MTTYDEAIDKAREIGGEHGENAAEWWEQYALGGRMNGRVEDPPHVARRILTGLDDGDPIVMDNLPAPDLSGEWADGYTPDMLADDCEMGDDWRAGYVDLTDLCDAYENAFSEAVEMVVRAACERALSV